MFPDAKKFFLEIVIKQFFSHGKNVSSWHIFFLAVRKNFLLQEKTSIAIRKNMFCHYITEKFS